MSEIKVILEAFTQDKSLDSSIVKLQKVIDLTERIKANKGALGAGGTATETIKLTAETEKLSRARKKETAESIKSRVEQQLKNAESRKQARLESDLTGAYDKQSIRLNNLRKQYKDLAVQKKENTKEAQKLLKEVQNLDSSLKKVDATVGQHQRNVGNYRDALGKLVPIVGEAADAVDTFGGALLKLAKSPIGIAIAAVAALTKVIYDNLTATQAQKDQAEALEAGLKAQASALDVVGVNSNQLRKDVIALTLEEKKLQDSRINSLVIQQELRTEAAVARSAAAEDGRTNAEKIRFLGVFIEKTKAALETEREELQKDVDIKFGFVQKYGIIASREQNKQYQEALAALKKLDADLLDETIKTQKQIAALKEAERKRILVINQKIAQEEEERIKNETNVLVQQSNEEIEAHNATIDAIEKTREEAAEKRKADQIKQIEEAQKTAALITNMLQAQSDKRLDIINNEIDKEAEKIDRQQELADRGLANTLAFEEKKKAELEKAAIDEQKRKEKIKKIEAFFNLFSEYAKEDPKTALPKSIRDIALATAFSSAFAEDGGIVGDIAQPVSGGKIVNGIFKGRSHKQGGIHLEAQGEEGIFSKKEMRNLGVDNFYSLKELSKRPVDDSLFERQNASFVRDVPIVYNNNSEVVKAVLEVVETIKNKEEFNYKGFTKDYKYMVTELKKNGNKTVTKYKF